jgi:hypothetical protein
MGWSIPQAPAPQKAVRWSPWVCLFITGAGYLAALAWVVLSTPFGRLPALSSGYYLPVTGYTLTGVGIALTIYLVWWEAQALRFFSLTWWQHNTYRAWRAWALESLVMVKSVMLTAEPGLIPSLAGIQPKLPEDDEGSKAKTLNLDGAVIPGLNRFTQICRTLLEDVAPSLVSLPAHFPITVYLQTTGDEDQRQGRFENLWNEILPGRALELHLLSDVLPFEIWNQTVLSSPHPVLALALHYRQPGEEAAEIATALLLSPAGLLNITSGQSLTRLFRAMPVNPEKLVDELSELKAMAQQPADNIRLLWFSGLSDSAKQSLSTAAFTMQLPLSGAVPGGGVIDVDQGGGHYGSLSGWLLAGIAAQMAEQGQGSQWVVCENNGQTWAMAVGRHNPSPQPPHTELPGQPFPCGGLSLGLLFCGLVFGAVGTAWPQWLFSGWGFTVVLSSLLLVLPGCVLGLRYLISRVTESAFIRAAQGPARGEPV